MRTWLVLICALLLAACGPSGPRFNSTDITGADYAKDFRLKDANGQTRTLADFKGMAVEGFLG